MATDCSQTVMEFQEVDGRRVLGDFDGGNLTSDGGALLLREADLHSRITERFASCFDDRRDAGRIEHTVLSLLRQRVHGLALGYEDVNDHETLRHDAAFHLLAGEGDFEEPLAGKSTLNRLEVSASVSRRNDRYHKITFHPDRFHGVLRDLFFESHREAPAEVVLDLDATDLPLHGAQEGRFFHGYYDGYCYLPLYIFCGDHILHAELRVSNIDAAKGAIEALAAIVEEIRRRWPKTRIIIRADSGFCRDWLMNWCEEKGVCYVLGLAKNERLLGLCARQLERARRKHLVTKLPARVYTSLRYRTRDSWSCKRRVVAKCEHINGKANPRFVVTNLLSCEMGDADLYERGYCPRGDAENRIGEQMDLFADRSSCSAFDANQLRLAFSAMAYSLFLCVRRALAGTELERARPQTVRLRLFKIGALVRTSVRRIVLAFASGCPWAGLVRQCLAGIRSLPPPLAA
ncbi:MAG TPA: IS1380 family transposase [Phycisphaerales bacterium]|nr:IS1380 family transposase [Phycisphaerales bacterium]